MPIAVRRLHARPWARLRAAVAGVLSLGLGVLLCALLAGAGATSAQAASLPYRVTAEVAMPGVGYGIAVDSASGRIYVAGRFAGAVYVFDEADLSLLDTIPVPNEPINLTVGPTGLVYVTQYTATAVQGSVAVVDPDEGAVIATVPVGKSPYGLIVSRDGARLFVCNSSSNFMSVLDLSAPRSPAMLPDMPIPGRCENPALDADGTTLFLATNGNWVYRIDVATGALQSTWTGFTANHQVSLSLDETRGFVSQQLGGEMPVHDLGSNARIGTLPLVNTYYQSTDAALNTGFVTQPFTNGGTVAVIDATTGEVQQSLTGVRVPFHIVTDESTHATFTTSLSQTRLTKIEPVSPVMTLDPVSQIVEAGSSATFTAEATGLAPISVQWERSADDGATWSDVPGAIEPSFTTPATTLEDDGLRFRARFSDARGVSVWSEPAALTVTAIPVAVLEHPVSTTVVEGRLAHFRASATGTPPITVQWQRSADDGETWVDLSEATGLELEVGPVELSADGDRFRAVFTGPGADNTATTAEATLRVTPAPDPDPDPDPDPTSPPSPTPAPTLPGSGTSADPGSDSGSQASLRATGASVTGVLGAVGGAAVLIGAAALGCRPRRSQS